MLLNRIHIFVVLIFCSVALTGCGDSGEQKVDFNNEASLKNLASNLLDKEVKFVSAGYFSSEIKKSIVAGTEYTENDKWGISFSLIEKIDDEFEVVYNTGYLEGSFNRCVVNKMKFSSDQAELIYYDSQDFYIGSGGGDVFLYLINMVKKEIYYAHLVINRTTGASLFLSDNIEDPIIKKFFVSYFKKDYPGLRIVETDIL